MSGIPETAIPDVLVRLGRTAAQLSKMPHQCGAGAAEVYRQLANALEQVERLTEVVE